MAHEVLVPPLGQTTDTVTLVKWYKNEGDLVQQGEPLFAIETDKAVLDVESHHSGVLRRVSATENQEVKVLTAVALLAEQGEVLGEQEQQVALAADTVAAPKQFERRTGTVPERLNRLLVSPRARRLATEESVPLDQLAGTGPEGAIVERDVRTYLAHPREQVAAPEIAPMRGIHAERPMDGVRAIIAERMAESVSTTASVTLTTEVDASGIVQLRALLAEDGARVSYNDILLLVLARTLGEHRALNASLEGGVIRQWEQINIGLAVDSERGLVVPVIKDADQKGLVDLAEDTQDLVERARAGRLQPEEMQGGTFTLTNLGMFGIDAFTPIINLPETAILGVGRIKARPVVQDGRIVAMETAWLSLTFDHRLVDGALAACFLQRAAQFIEHPGLLLS